MQCRFIDREEEFRVLEAAWSRRPGLVIIYGRRRIGKTRLLVEWLRRLRAHSVYYVAQLSSYEHNLSLLAEKAARSLGDQLIARARPATLPDLLSIIARAGAEIVVIDEFTYWARSSPRVVSELQYFVDHMLPETVLLLVLSGSLVGVMERSIVGGGAPLYGRATARLRLGQLGFTSLKELLPHWSSVDLVRLYSLFGGIPFYLCQAARLGGIEEAVRELIVSPGAPLRDEKDLLLREELRDPHTYNAVLSALARGYDTPSRIASVAGIDQSHVYKYLSILEYLGFVEKRRPLFSRKGRYVIADPVLRTWFSLVEPLLELLEAGLAEEAVKAIMARLDQHASRIWEDLVRRHLLRLYAGQGYTVAGFLEYRGEELDTVLLDTREKRAVVAEAKWTTMSLGEAEKLRREAVAKAYRLLPRGYTVAKAYVAVRELKEGEEEPGWIITPSSLEAS